MFAYSRTKPFRERSKVGSYRTQRIWLVHSIFKNNPTMASQTILKSKHIIEMGLFIGKMVFVMKAYFRGRTNK